PALGIRDRPTAPRSPWQNAYVEQLIGSVRREYLDHLIVFGEAHPHRIVSLYASYHNEARTHLSLAKDAPISRPIETVWSPHCRAHGRWPASSLRSNLVFGRDRDLLWQRREHFALRDCATAGRRCEIKNYTPAARRGCSCPGWSRQARRSNSARRTPT